MLTKVDKRGFLANSRFVVPACPRLDLTRHTFTLLECTRIFERADWGTLYMRGFSRLRRNLDVEWFIVSLPQLTKLPSRFTIAWDF